MARFDLNLLAALDALLREKNVTIAADKVGVSQPTMSGMLNRLRERLNDPLLIRVGRSFELTPRAKELAEHVRQTLLTVDRLVAPRANFELRRAKRHVRIMASDASLLIIIPAMFRSAAEAAPNLTFEVVPIENPVQQVYQGSVDLCLTGENVDDVEGAAASAVRTKTLISDRPVGVVDKAHPLNDEITLKQFFEYPYVSVSFPGTKRTAEDTLLPGLSIDHPPRIRVPTFMAIGAAVSGTHMIGLMPSRLIPILPETWNLKTLTLPKEFARMTLRALWHSRQDNDAIHQWLRATALASCVELLPAG